MIVKILSKSATFRGVKYNTDKIGTDKGELMKVSGFEALQGLSNLRPADYINYLQAISAQSSRIKFPQFHAVMSTKGREHSKEQLTSLAEAWLKEMGYGTQPYLLVFHKDTANNHIHMVSTRVGRNGKKISDKYERVRAGKVMERLLGGHDLQAKVKSDIELALSYKFSTRAQFMMVLEAKGYSLQLNEKEYRLFGQGKELGRVSLQDVDSHVKSYCKDGDRIRQLRAIIEKYHGKYSPVITPVFSQLPGQRDNLRVGYTSKLAEMLRDKFGLQTLFHFKDDKPPYGYTILDHAKKTVLKGGEILDLATFISPGTARDDPSIKTTSQSSNRSAACATRSSEVHEELQSFMQPDIEDAGSLQQQSPAEYLQPGAGEIGPGEAEYIESLPQLQLNLSDDIDDEAILGRNRRRQRKARTNTR